MDTQTHLICENAQNITLQAWPDLYGDDNKYDQDSRDLLAIFRDWAEEFEAWWQSHSMDWIEDADYILEIEAFTEKKVKEFIEIHER